MDEINLEVFEQKPYLSNVWIFRPIMVTMQKKSILCLQNFFSILVAVDSCLDGKN